MIISLQEVEADCVTGPGRSGAVAAAYASHYLRIPFIPYGKKKPKKFDKMLIIDTARQSGKTLRKAEKKYANSIVIAVYEEPPRVAFWYEAQKPQRYKHESYLDCET
jgi:adenine/guanine phosphoribosyltransferase-like PRPP-binding protein